MKKLKLSLTGIITAILLIHIVSCEKDNDSPEINKIPIEGLIAYYPFNNNANDESGNNNHGKVNGALLTTDRNQISNSAYNFDGIDDFIEIDTISDLAIVNNFTISIWFYLNDWKDQSDVIYADIDQQYIFNGHASSSTANSNYIADGFNVVAHLDNFFEEYISNLTYDLSGNVFKSKLYSNESILDKWIHNVFIRKTDSTYHYLNGELIKTKVNDGDTLFMNHNLYIGTFSGNNPNYFNYNSINYNFYGKIDDIRIYNKAISKNDVAALYEESQQLK